METLVKVNLEPLKKWAEKIETACRNGGGAGGVSGAIGAAFRQWGARFRSFVQLRFDKFSKGGGDWKPLADSTKRARRGARKGAKGARSFALLRDTGTLFMALTPEFKSEPGQLEEGIPFGVRVGFGGPARHPNGTATIADIANFHQHGGPHLPMRKIIVPLDQHTVDLMSGDMQRAIDKLADGEGA
jgi:hypothetical protein